MLHTACVHLDPEKKKDRIVFSTAPTLSSRFASIACSFSLKKDMRARFTVPACE